MPAPVKRICMARRRIQRGSRSGFKGKRSGGALLSFVQLNQVSQSDVNVAARRAREWNINIWISGLLSSISIANNGLSLSLSSSSPSPSFVVSRESRKREAAKP